MSYVAEPYAQFVDDLVTGLTGGHVRESFRMLEEEMPFRLGSAAGILPNTIRVYGHLESGSGAFEFHRFVKDTDYRFANEHILVAATDGVGGGQALAQPRSYFVHHHDGVIDQQSQGDNQTAHRHLMDGNP